MSYWNNDNVGFLCVKMLIGIIIARVYKRRYVNVLRLSLDIFIDIKGYCQSVTLWYLKVNFGCF